MENIICGILILLGAIFTFIASLGMLRMPDLFMRMHAGTKAGTLGVSLILLSAMLEFSIISVTTKAIIAILFFFITIPIGAHMLGRAAYFINIPLWKNTVVDELRQYFDEKAKSAE